MKPASRGSKVDLLDPEKFKILKGSKEQFNKIMARHLLGNMVTLFVENGVVKLDSLVQISRMKLDDAMRFLSNSPQIKSRNLPVARSFLKCADEAMVEQIFEHTQRLALNYLDECAHLNANGCEDANGLRESRNSKPE